jgi:hypothetical protein
VAVATAEADYKVEIEKCEALPSEQQGSCKDVAEATLEAAKLRAQAERDDADRAAEALKN